MRILVTIPDEWVPVLDEKCGIATRTAWIRHQLELVLFKKEAVVPLVPDGPVRYFTRESAEAYSGSVVVTRRGVRPEDIVIPEPKPEARRKSKAVQVWPAEYHDGTSIVQSTPVPARCNRGACTGTIHPVSGRCLRCNQIPLKESK